MSQDTDNRKALILEQKYKLLDFIHERNFRLDDRADRIVQIGGIIVGLTAIANLQFDWSSLAEGFPQAWPAVLIGGSLFAFLCSVMFSLFYYLDITYESPGTTDWNETYKDYLFSDDYYKQLLTDVLGSVQSALEVNRQKNRGVKVLSFMLALQILLFAAGWGATLRPS